jgi:hypothetical protein
MDEATKKLLKSRVPGLHDISSYTVIPNHKYMSFYDIAANVHKFIKKIDVHLCHINNVIYANNINIIIVDSPDNLDILRYILKLSFNLGDDFNISGRISILTECIRCVLKT